MSYSLYEWCQANKGLCPACGSAKLVNSHVKCVFSCDYCGLTISEQVMELSAPDSEYVASVLYKLKSAWEHRVKMLKEMGTQALIDELSSRGLHLPPKQNSSSLMLNEMMKKIYEPMINEQLKADLVFLTSNPNISEPKPWSYEEAAASEFNLEDEGTGLQ